MQKLILITMAVFFMMACKKEETKTATFLDEIDGKQFNKTEILISLNDTEDTIPNITVTPEPCKADNVWSFNKTDKTFTLDEGERKCLETDLQTKDEGRIELIENGNSLKVAGSGTNEIWNIESRSASSFRVSYFAKNTSNENVKFRVTFTKL